MADEDIDEVIEEFFGTMNLEEFKRIQSATIIKVILKLWMKL